MSTLKQIPLLKKPAPKPVAKPSATTTTPTNAAAKPAPAVVQQAGPALPPNIAKKLTQLENELKAEKEKNVALQEKIAKKQEDKNAWRERIYPLADVEQWALARGDQPLPGDWRLEYHNKYVVLFPYDVDREGNVIPRPDLPARICLCLIPSSEIPVEPGESAQTNRVNRARGYMALYDDFLYAEDGSISGVRGVPGAVPGDAFVALLVPSEEEETKEASEPAPEPAPEPKIEKPVKKLQKN
jgi:hypothetical protein